MVTSSFRRYDGDYAGQHVYSQATGLSRRHEVHVIYPTNRDIANTTAEPFQRHPFAYPFRTYPMAQVRRTDMLNVPRLFTRMQAEIRRVKREHDIDLFYAFWTIPSGFICSVTCGKTPFIIGLAGADDKVFGRGGIASPFIRHAVGRAARIIALSQDLKRDAVARGAHERNVSVIPSGIDINEYKPRDKAAVRARLGLPDHFLVLYAGSLFSLKRVDWLVRQSARLGSKHRFDTLIIGDGPEKENLKGLASQLGATNVHFMGSIPYHKVPVYMSASDALVLFSETEGLPSCVQEALASGIPVVATGVGGMNDLVRNGITGYIVDTENEAGDRLAHLLDSPQLVAQMGANAREFAEDYLCSERVFERVNAVCESVFAPAEKKVTTPPRTSTATAAIPPRARIGIVSTFPANYISDLIDVQLPYVDRIHVVAPELHRQDVHFHPFRYKIGKNLFAQMLNQVTSQLRMSWEVIGLSRDVDFWIFLAGDVFALPVMVAKFVGRPVMLSLLGNLEYETALKKNALNPVQRLLRRLNCALANRIIVFSRGLAMKWELDGYRRKVIVAQSQHVDLERFTIRKPLAQREDVVGYVGRLSPEKGVWNLVSAIPLILRMRPETRFAIVGDGPLKDSIKEYLESTGVARQVDLAGKAPYEQVPDRLNQMRLLVMPSYSEGLPVTLLEAMACGTPVLATPAGAVDEIIISGRTGLLLKNNSPETIAAAVVEGLDRPGAYSIALAARALMERGYSLAAARRNYHKVILEGSLLSRHHRGRSGYGVPPSRSTA